MDNVFIPPHNTIAPDTIAWFPPSIWLVLLLLCFLALLLYMVIALRRYRKYTRARREAYHTLVGLLRSSAPTAHANRLLKQVAQTYYNQHVSSLHGTQWVTFWSIKLPTKKRAKHTEVLTELQNSLYQSVPQTLSIKQFETLKACMNLGLPKFSWITLRANTSDIQQSQQHIDPEQTFQAQRLTTQGVRDE